jgi:hypothetical protein
MVIVRTDVSKEHIASIFRVKYYESFWFAAKMYLTTDGEENILHCYHRENIKSYNLVLNERLIITLDAATACQLHLHGNRHDNGDIVARGSLTRPPCGTFPL